MARGWRALLALVLLGSGITSLTLQHPRRESPADARTRSARSASAAASEKCSTRADGRWCRFSLERAGFRPGDSIYDLAAGGSVFVAVGVSVDGFRSRVWKSSDGLEWKSVVPPAANRRFHPVTRAAIRNNVLVIVVDAAGTKTDEHSELWWTDNLRDWHRIRRIRGTINDLTASPRGFVAVGATGLRSRDEGRPRVWHSPDGRSWSRGIFTESLGANVSRLARVTRLGRGYLAWGGGNVTSIVTSKDGRRWTKGTVPGADPLVEIGTGSKGVIAITEPRARLGGSLWFTTDGATWTELPHFHARFPGGSPDDVTALEDTVIVVGSSPTPDGFRPVGAWSSKNLLSWDEMPPTVGGTPMGGPNSASGVAVAAGKDRVLFVAHDAREIYYWLWFPSR